MPGRAKISIRGNGRHEETLEGSPRDRQTFEPRIDTKAHESGNVPRNIFVFLRVYSWFFLDLPGRRFDLQRVSLEETVKPGK